MEVQAIKWQDVNGKELLYIKISNGKNYEMINVGVKTYEKINKLVNNEHVQPKPEKTNKMDK